MDGDLFVTPDLDLFPESRLTYRLSEHLLDGADVYGRILVAGFSGEYRVGSAGTSDAEYMIAILGAALARFEPDAVVLDLTELDYRWGNGLLGVFECMSQSRAFNPPGLVIVAGQTCRPALQSLLTPVGRQPPSLLHSDRDTAIRFALDLAVERNRKLE